MRICTNRPEWCLITRWNALLGRLFFCQSAEKPPKHGLFWFSEYVIALFGHIFMAVFLQETRGGLPQIYEVLPHPHICPKVVNEPYSKSHFSVEPFGIRYLLFGVSAF